MGFAKQYLEKNRLFGDFIDPSPREDLKYIVVIPCYNEDRITKTLDSLWNAERPQSSVEILVVVNTSEQSSESIRERNRQTLEEVTQWRKLYADPGFEVYPLQPPDLPEKDFGAGMARKIGMDEAINRFEKLSRDSGYIISLDADTTVAENYFIAIEQTIEACSSVNLGIIYFEHPVDGDDFPAEIYHAVAQYELFLRYYNQGLRWTGFPYAFHTIGSAFFVRALAYVKQGGMIRRKAGEDFYFLNKIFQLGNIREVNSTAVYPSPRFSDRVLFGTGPEVEKISRAPEKPYMAYHPKAFYTLRKFFAGIDHLFQCCDDETENFPDDLDPGLKRFLEKNGFLKAVKRINNNCKRPEIFRKHFFQWFGGLKIIQYMHGVHETYLEKIPVQRAAREILETLGYHVPYEDSNSADILQLLRKYRTIERRSDYII